MLHATSITRAFRHRAFYAGLLLTALLYGGAFLWAGLSSNAHLDSIQDRLNSQTIPIIRAENQHAAPGLAPKGDLLEDEKLLEPPPADSAETAEVIPTTPAPDTAPHNSGETFPIAGLFENTADGHTLPVIRKHDGMSPFRAYSKTYTPVPAGKPLIALVINDVGLSPAIAAKLHAELPAEVTFIVNPYANSLNVLEKQWHADKREIWLKIPFETASFPQDDPGMRGILTRASLSQNMDNFKWALSRLAAYSGVAARIDNSYLQARPLLGALAKEGFDRGLGYFELNNSAPPQIKDMAERQKMPYIRSEINLHDPKWNGEINEAASLLETVAESKGYAIGVLQPYPETVDFLKKWISTLRDKNFVFVPLSSIYTHKLAQSPASGAPPVSPAVQQPSEPPASSPASQQKSQNHDNNPTSH